MIGMRVSKTEVSCEGCGVDIRKTYKMFDVMVGNFTFSLCDKCVDKLLSKTLKAICMCNEETKTPDGLKKYRRES